jgi:bifunctional non-homologous end joining protein LigD
MSLTEYHHKRDFRKTPEPRGKQGRKHARDLAFVIQKHAASRLHYDFRLEWDGTLKSWAVPKGPSLDPKNKQLAVQVEDHPLSYGDFEGIIPQGEYGGGTVMLWDRGIWEPIGDAGEGFKSGKLKFILHGEKLQGHWTLVRMRGRAGDDGKNWLLIKERDDEARPESEYSVTEDLDRSVSTERSLEEIANAEDRIWKSNRKSATSKSASPVATKVRRKASKKTPQEPLDLDLANLAGAKKSRLPETLAPQLATLSAKAPAGENWVHEMKFDGYRILAFLDQGKVKLETRNGNDWTRKFKHVVNALKDLPVRSAVLDGEVVVLKPDGTPDFQRLQNVLKSGEQSELIYYVFDLPYCEGFDLRSCTLLDRKQILGKIMRRLSPDNLGTLRYSEHLTGDGPEVLKSACEHHLEGIVSKQADSTYSSSRSQAWLKTKCLQRQEFVIGGYTRPGGERKGFGSLILGYHDRQGELVYCGRVGTGFTAQSLKQLSALLKKKVVDACPFASAPREAKRELGSWVQPDLVAEVEFTEWTSDGSLRHPSFKGLREDKPAREITREEAQMPEKDSSSSSKQHETGRQKASKAPVSDSEEENVVAGISLTHPHRVIYPEIELTKQELATYYADIADWILPHVVDRPLSLVRCPRGQGEKCFYQKHFDDELPEGLIQFPIREKRATENYVVIKSLPGLIWLVQIGVLEIHPWGSKIDAIERPDQVIFDLDPGEGVTWEQIVQGARDVKSRLEDLGLESFLRTSGGKGLHICVPLVRRRDWEETKDFTHALASAMMRDDPARYIDTLSKQKRKGRIFVDYLRNGRGATAIASYSTRARKGAPVATPVRWDELNADLKPNQYTVHNVRQRLAALKDDPWRGYFDVRQSITNAMLKKLQSH